VSFHSYYDFGYLLRICTCVPLPEFDRDFFAVLQRFSRAFSRITSIPLLQPLTSPPPPPTPLRFFPCIYDIKHLIHTFDDLHGGLGNIATQVLLPQPHAPSPSRLSLSSG
jgi:CCR4-NOT transcription complex subunit 7/8